MKYLAVPVSQNAEARQKTSINPPVVRPPEEPAAFGGGESSCEAKQYFMEKLLKILHWSTVGFSVCRASFEISWKICTALKSSVDQSEVWGTPENKPGGEQPFQALPWAIFAARIPGCNLLGRSEGQRPLPGAGRPCAGLANRCGGLWGEASQGDREQSHQRR